uniref:Cytochrome P450 n=1 Tax=Rhodonia placenta TaxID=104341 RepID=F1SYF6_9APHY|nr:cytochrome P450 [Postia placenta]
MGFTGIIYAICVCILIFTAASWLRKQRARWPYPPGPSGLPIVGNTFQVPLTEQWLKYAEWAKTYGDVMHLSVLGRSIIVLSSASAISDLLDKRSVHYSDRPVVPMAGEMVGFSRYIALEHYGGRLKEGRKLITNSLSTRNMPEVQRMQEMKVIHLVSRLMSSPADFRLNLRWFMASVVFQYSHGYEVETFEDYYVKLAEQVAEDFSRAVQPGKFLVDSLPFLMHVPDWMPGTGFKATAGAMAERLQRLADESYHHVQTQVARGTAPPSFTANLIENNPHPTPDEEDMYKTTAMVFYVAGADTTTSVLEALFLAMTLYPDIQQKAQAEVDRVVGFDRLPNFSDRLQLPYVEGLIKEIYRLNQVFPLALPHCATQDGVYAGYHIPEKSIVIANSWAVVHDPALYPQPFDILPERYLKQEDGLNPDPRCFTFGYGRRVCPGQRLADDSVFIVTATVLATLDICQTLGPDGLPIKPKATFGGGAVCHPGPFECTITPRSIDAERLVIHAASALVG